MAKYGSLPAGAARHLSLHKRTVSLVLAISAVMALAACVAFANRGQRVGLEARVEGMLPYANMEQLASNHHIWVGGHDLNPVHMVHNYREHHAGWTKEQGEKSPAAGQASMNMPQGGATQQQLYSFATEAKNVETSLAQDMRKLWKAKTPAAKEADLKMVEVMKGRFEALQQAAESSPVLEVLPSRNDGLMHVVDPRTGRVYTLYEDEYLEPHPLFSNDMKGLAPFADPAGRNPTYQGVYPDYDSIYPAAAKMARAPASLYEYHVPGGYEDAELEPHPLFGGDLKGLAPFPDAAGRNPTYQGEHFDYDALGTAAGPAEAVAQRPQGLYQYRRQPAEFVVADRAGQLRLVSRQNVRGMIAAQRNVAADREWAMKKPQVVARKEAEVAAMRKQMSLANKAHAKAAPAAHKAKKVRTAMKAVTQELAEEPKMVETATRQWGSIYQPSVQSVNSQDPTPLSGAGKAMFNHWSSLATKYNKVYDPTEDKSAAHNFGGDALKGPWWSAAKEGDDAWWNHDHSNRGY